MYLPRVVKKGKHYAIYKEAKGVVKTKAALLKDALAIAAKEKKHIEMIDFIPSKFTLQVHGWFDTDDKTGYMKLSQVEVAVNKALAAGKDPVKELRGKWHYDLRIQKATAPTWFGLTPFRAPWTGIPANKVQGSVKGYQAIAPGSKKLEEFLSHEAEKSMAKEGVAERRDRLEWMKIKSQWFKKNSPGNPQKNQDAAMVSIEFFKPACLHRRDLDFIDVTFFGKYLKGRYYNRLVERKIKAEELMEWQKQAIVDKKAKEFYKLDFYFWKAKDQWGTKTAPYSEQQVLRAALGKKTLDPIPAPPSKTKKAAKTAPKEAPLATAQFH